MQFKDTPNREIYKTSIWKSINPTDRAHILLVAEGVKPMAYADMSDLKDIKDYISKELKLFFVEARGRRAWYKTSVGIDLPHRVYTIYKSDKTLRLIQRLWSSNRSNYQDREGELLGFPKCCRKEYSNPTYNKRFNGFILKFFRRPYTFLIQAVKMFLEGREIPKEYLYLMPSQTPCSVECKKSLNLLKVWRELLRKYDPEAAKTLEEFNEYNVLREIKEITTRLKERKITSVQFEKGYIFS